MTNSLVAAADGSIWVATHDGLMRWKNEQITIFRKSSGLPDDATQSLLQDDRGRIWVFTHHGLAYFEDGRFVAVNGVPSAEVYSITGDQAGNLWLSGNRGLSAPAWRDVWSNISPGQRWDVVNKPRSSSLSKAGFGSHSGRMGACCISRMVRSALRTQRRTGWVRARSPVFDSIGMGRVWAATEEGGLSRIKDGRIATLTTNNGLPCDAIHWSMEDDDRSFWLYTACGLVRITRSELDAWIAEPTHRVQTTVWDAADGVRLRQVSPGYYGPPVAKSTDGKLWFHTGEGIQVVDPRHVAFNKLPPPVHIEQVIADGTVHWRNLPGAAVSSLRLPARTRDLQIDYTALSLVAPEKVHFKYKLEGQDRDWREVVNARQAQYTNLRPRTYRFRVIACNNSGVWNEEGDALEFSIAPAYYQTNWFLALCAAGTAGVLWTAWRRRLRRLRHQLELTLDARVAERTRIARDLHDTLLQSSQGMLLIFESAVRLLPERPVEARERLERALDQAAEAMAEARDAVQGLRDSVTESNDLVPSLTRIVQELSAGGAAGAPAMQVVFDGTPRPLKPLVRDEVYRIAAEALRNAARHAKARQIRAEIRYEERRFRLLVRDDGVGIDEETLREAPTGHFGLHGMRERAAIVGGRLEVLTRAGLGTVVELSIPAAIAYATSRRRPVAVDPTGAAPAEHEDPR